MYSVNFCLLISAIFLKPKRLLILRGEHARRQSDNAVISGTGIDEGEFILAESRCPVTSTGSGFDPMRCLNDDPAVSRAFPSGETDTESYMGTCIGGLDSLRNCSRVSRPENFRSRQDQSPFHISTRRFPIPSYLRPLPRPHSTFCLRITQSLVAAPQRPCRSWVGSNDEMVVIQ